MVPIIRSIFSNSVGEEAANQIEIVANDVDLSQGSGLGQWTIKYWHPESYVFWETFVHLSIITHSL